MRMRLPVHVWGILTRGREAESVQIEQVSDAEYQCEGIGFRERWREYDGEQCWPWRTKEDGDPTVREWTEFFVARMMWTRISGVWYGEWMWEEHDRYAEPRYPGFQEGAERGVPQELLLILIESLAWVRSSPFTFALPIS